MLKTYLDVNRRYSNGKVTLVGRLAENHSGIYFQYNDEYLATHSKSISPIAIKLTNRLQRMDNLYIGNLQGVFADCLPDGWGLHLLKRQMELNKQPLNALSHLEHLAMIGNRTSGALFFEPSIPQPEPQEINLYELGAAALKEFEGIDTPELPQLITAIGAKGEIPKLNVTIKPDGTYTTDPLAEGTQVIFKLSSDKFAYGHNEILIEWIFLEMAREVGIDVPDFDLIPMNTGHYWLQLKRFDCNGGTGRFHMLSASDLFNTPVHALNLDYQDLIKVSYELCGIQAARQMLRRALFNFLALNHNDHGRSFAFLADDNDKWRLSPQCGLNFTPFLSGHSTTFIGHRDKIPKKVLDTLSKQAGLSGYKNGMKIAEEVYETLRTFRQRAKAIWLDKDITKTIQQEIDKKWKILTSY